jgi:hypothetical protein
MSLYKPTFDKDLRGYYDYIKESFVNLKPQVQAVNLAK